MLFALGLLATASAEDSTFAGTAGPETKEKPETHVTGELGGAFATGNSNYYTVNGLLNASHQFDKNKFTFGAGVNVGGARALVDTDGDGVAETLQDEYTENVRRVFGEARYDRFLSDKDSLYALAGAFHDKFAGYDLRSHEQVGYSRLLVKTEPTELKAELGFDVAQENYYGNELDPDYQNILAARVLLGLNHKFNDKVSFGDTFELYENVIDFEDVRILNTAALTSTLSGKFSIKVSHALIFDNVPVDGLKPLDQTTMVTLVATLL